MDAYEVDFSDLSVLLEQEISKSGDEKFFDKMNIRGIVSGDFSRMKKMKQRLVLQNSAMAFFVAVCGWLDYQFPINFSYIMIAPAILAGIFAGLEILAFYMYWDNSTQRNSEISIRTVSKRFYKIALGMRMIKLISGLFILVLLFIDANVIHVFSWDILAFLIILQISFFLFSRKWIFYAEQIAMNEKVKSATLSNQ